ncbi:plasminogen activator inhibitor [Anaeramoeba ignava]|uniref:Plasminogen activator inhibitor n=1 Tax=Anaeramoeba ignava TaxID=1746090 RepID=A0A9Q0REF9_ANAIG|nr:plasminogen activator inhibitor [Anaeramoeba ignava]
MGDLDISITQWITFSLSVLAILCIIGLIFFILQKRKRSFNKIWHFRVNLALTGLIWLLSILLSATFFWSEKGFFPLSETGHKIACLVTLTISRGFAQPFLFLLIFFLLQIRMKTQTFNISKTSKKSCLRSLLFILPMLAVQGILIAVNVTQEKSNVVYNIYDYDNSRCIIPIVSTLAFAIFSFFFLFFFLFRIIKFAGTLKNESFRSRLFFVMWIFILSILGNIGLSFPSQNEYIILFHIIVACITLFACFYTFIIRPILGSRGLYQNLEHFDSQIQNPKLDQEISGNNEGEIQLEDLESQETKKDQKSKTKEESSNEEFLFSPQEDSKHQQPQQQLQIKSLQNAPDSLDISDSEPNDVDTVNLNADSIQTIKQMTRNSRIGRRSIMNTPAVVQNVHNLDGFSSDDLKDESEDNIPKDSLKKDNIPKDSLKKENIPKESLKKDNIPKDSLKKENIPKESLKKDNIPKDSLKKDNIPKDSLKKENIPKDSLKKENIPKESLKKENIPKDSLKDEFDFSNSDENENQKDENQKDQNQKDENQKDENQKNENQKNENQKDENQNRPHKHKQKHRHKHKHKNKNNKQNKSISSEPPKRNVVDSKKIEEIADFYMNESNDPTNIEKVDAKEILTQSLSKYEKTQSNIDQDKIFEIMQILENQEQTDSVQKPTHKKRHHRQHTGKHHKKDSKKSHSRSHSQNKNPSKILNTNLDINIDIDLDNDISNSENQEKK